VVEVYEDVVKYCVVDFKGKVPPGKLSLRCLTPNSSFHAFLSYTHKRPSHTINNGQIHVSGREKGPKVFDFESTV